MPSSPSVPPSEEKNTFLTAFELENLTTKKDELFSKLKDWEKGIEELGQIYFKLSHDIEYQNLLVETQNTFLKKLEDRKKSWAEQNLSPREIEEEENRVKKTLSLDNQVMMSYNFINPDPLAHQVLEKIQWIIKEDLGLQWEDLNLEWNEVITLCCNLNEFKNFIKKKKKISKI